MKCFLTVKKKKKKLQGGKLTIFLGNLGFNLTDLVTAQTLLLTQTIHSFVSLTF